MKVPIKSIKELINKISYKDPIKFMEVPISKDPIKIMKDSIMKYLIKSINNPNLKKPLHYQIELFKYLLYLKQT